MKKILTKKEEDFWFKYIDYHFYLLREPTREEIAKFFDISPQLVQYYINILKVKGWIKDGRKYKQRSETK